jgi:hypothetical protein
MVTEPSETRIFMNFQNVKKYGDSAEIFIQLSVKYL